MRQALRTCPTNRLRSSSLPIAEPPPVGGHTGATTEPTTKPFDRTLSARRLSAVVVHLDVDVRVEQEQVHAVELDAIHLGLGRQVEHRVEVNARFSAGAAFADEAGPHGVVEFGVSCCDYVLRS